MLEGFPEKNADPLFTCMCSQTSLDRTKVTLTYDPKASVVSIYVQYVCGGCHVAPPCFYGNPEWTSQTLVPDMGFHLLWGLKEEVR